MIFQALPRGILRPPSASFAVFPPSPPEDSPGQEEVSPRSEAARSQLTPAVTARRRRAARRSPSPSPPPARRPSPPQATRFPSTDIRYRVGYERRPAMKAAVRKLAATCSGRKIRRAASTARTPSSPGRALVPLRAASPAPRMQPPPAPARREVPGRPQDVPLPPAGREVHPQQLPAAQEVHLPPGQERGQEGAEAAQEPVQEGTGAAQAGGSAPSGPWVPR